jgi:hypothetical protein
MSNEQSKVVTKVVDVRHKAPDQAIHELMQAAKDGFAVTKVVTRFNHTHVYLETSSKQVSTSNDVSETSSKRVSTSKTADESSKETAAEKEEVKPVAKKTTTKSVASTKDTATTAKKTEQGDKDVE